MNRFYLFPGRKQGKDKHEFYTFIGHDALVAWKDYFTHVKSWSKGPLIDVSKSRTNLKIALRMRHQRLLRKLKVIKQTSSSKSNRYGYGVHDFRDVVRTLLHLEGVKDGIDFDCIEFWMGHVTDPLEYDKFYEDKAYVLGQYRIAEKYLNILSGATSAIAKLDDEALIDRIFSKPKNVEQIARIIDNWRNVGILSKEESVG